MAIRRESPNPAGLMGPTSPLATGRDQILHDIARGKPLAEILEALTRDIEVASPGTRSSILLLDRETSRLRVGAAPNLPSAFLRVIDEMFVEEKTGACGAAVHRGEVVIAEDLSVDPLGRVIWPLLEEFGLRSVVSFPVLDSSGQVVAAFATYSSERRRPTPEQLAHLQSASDLAAIAIEGRRHAERIGTLARELARVTAARHDEMRSLARTLSSDVLPPIESAERALQELVDRDGEHLSAAERDRILAAVAQARAFGQVAGELRRYVASIDRRPERAWIQPTEVVLEAWRSLAPLREGQQVGARIDSLPACFADRAMLLDLYRELLAKAIRATKTRPAGHIEVVAVNQDESVVYSVRDDGVGPENQGPPRTEASACPTAGTAGTKTGLALACSIVERHGGQMWLRSHPGAGNSVSFTLPRTPTEGIGSLGISVGAYAPPPR